MKKLLTIMILTLPLIAQAQVFDLTRSIVTVDVQNPSFVLTTYDTASTSVLDDFAHTWTRAQRREFANDPDNLLVVDDSTNQSKSDQAPHEWLPPMESFWCEYGKLWEKVKDKHGLHYNNQERITLNQLAETC